MGNPDCSMVKCAALTASEFTCPKCGSHDYGPTEQGRICHGSRDGRACGFEWLEKDDALHFSDAPRPVKSQHERPEYHYQVVVSAITSLRLSAIELRDRGAWLGRVVQRAAELLSEADHAVFMRRLLSPRTLEDFGGLSFLLSEELERYECVTEQLDARAPDPPTDAQRAMTARDFAVGAARMAMLCPCGQCRYCALRRSDPQAEATIRAEMEAKIANGMEGKAPTEPPPPPQPPPMH